MAFECLQRRSLLYGTYIYHDKGYGYEKTMRFGMIGSFAEYLLLSNVYFTVEEVVRIW